MLIETSPYSLQYYGLIHLAMLAYRPVECIDLYFVIFRVANKYLYLNIFLVNLTNLWALKLYAC